MAMERYSEIIPEFDEFLDYLEKPLPKTARVNTVKSDVEETREALEEAGVSTEVFDWYSKGLRLDIPDGVSIGNTLPHFLGWIHVHEEVSMIPSAVLDPDEDDHVLDICAAPGSKTTQIAAAVEEGSVTANDDNIGRIAALRNNTDRLGLTNVSVTNYDGRRMPGRDVFDSAVVDVPCSSEGTARKYPQHREGASLDRIRSLQGVQKGILSRTVDLVKPGGTVVYSTCTFAPEENEAVLDHVLGQKDVEVVDFSLGLNSEKGLTEWKGEGFDPSVERARRFYPHANDTGGFFVSKLKVK
ncbi:MAG: RsmB/NOP family class I SAM-dependent RNA methyltransferase [Halobacteria archaeon]|nr:RsmB/NOP family class I SAM-dependent RNA methyltransferase [Halobacteria archaeon]